MIMQFVIIGMRHVNKEAMNDVLDNCMFVGVTEENVKIDNG
jgi:hypothetical protein